MIADGYNRTVTLNDESLKLRFVYRPALDADRKHCRWMAKYLAYPEAFVDVWVTDHIVASGWTDTLSALRVQHESIYAALFLTIQGVRADDSGEQWIVAEKLLLENLRNGVELEMLHPRIARRSCESCQKLWYRQSDGLVILDGLGQPMERVGPTPCRTNVGCPKGTPENQKTLTTANQWAFAHFLDCDAIGVFPDDPIVARNARVIRSVMKRVHDKMLRRKPKE